MGTGSKGMTAIHLGISAAGTLVGTMAACATYTAMRGTANGTAFLVDGGARLLGFVLGQGTTYVAGSRIGDIVQTATTTTGTHIVAPTLRTSGEMGAAATAAAVGAGSALLTTGILYGGLYVGRQIYDRLPSMQQRNFLQHPEPTKFDVKEEAIGLETVGEGFAIVTVPSNHISQYAATAAFASGGEDAVAALVAAREAAAGAVGAAAAAAGGEVVATLADPDLPFSLSPL
jgi:hypothetical protein